jgi:predicted transcriptional regulator of viral defense system
VSLNHSVKKQQDERFGVEEIYRQGLSISITSLARTYVDLLDRVKLGGGWEEVIRSINKISVLNVDQVIQ